MRSFQSIRVISTFSLLLLSLKNITLHFAEREKQHFWLGGGSPQCRLEEVGGGGSTWAGPCPTAARGTGCGCPGRQDALGCAFPLPWLGSLTSSCHKVLVFTRKLWKD